MQIHACNAFEAKDLLLNSTDFAKIEIGDVVTDAFGKGVVHEGRDSSLASGQNVDAALWQLDMSQVAKVIVFFSQRMVGGNDVVMPTEIALVTPELRLLVDRYKERQAKARLEQLPSFNAGHDWF